MSETGFSGRVNGGNRAELVERAKALAATFYGKTCVAVALSNVTVKQWARGCVFTADFIAYEHHRLTKPNFGFPKCNDCHKDSYSNNPLPEWGGGE